MLNKKEINPDIQGEIEELQRVTQYLNRDEGVDISVHDLVNAFQKSKETTLTNEVWSQLENTESNEIEKGDFEKVKEISKTYDKSSPKKLAEKLKSGEYSRPLIVKFGDRYHLVAGNTRLCTAASLGMNPKVFIASVEVSDDLQEKWSEKYKKSIDCKNPKGFSQRAHCQGKKKGDTNETTGASSSGAYSAPLFGGKPVKINKIHNMTESELPIDEATVADSSGQYDAPFGSGGRNPLKIGGNRSVDKRIKDINKKKNFPKYGGPKGVFVKVKEKCKTFPYCNQGDINALEIINEVKGLKEAIKKIATDKGLPYSEVEKVVLNEINKIFISN